MIGERLPGCPLRMIPPRQRVDPKLALPPDLDPERSSISRRMTLLFHARLQGFLLDLVDLIQAQLLRPVKRPSPIPLIRPAAQTVRLLQLIFSFYDFSLSFLTLTSSSKEELSVTEAART